MSLCPPVPAGKHGDSLWQFVNNTSVLLVDCSLWPSAPMFVIQAQGGCLFKLSLRTRAAQSRTVLMSTKLSFYDKCRWQTRFLPSGTLYQRTLFHQHWHTAFTLRHLYEHNSEPSSGISLKFVPKCGLTFEGSSVCALPTLAHQQSRVQSTRDQSES